MLSLLLACGGAAHPQGSGASSSRIDPQNSASIGSSAAGDHSPSATPPSAGSSNPSTVEPTSAKADPKRGENLFQTNYCTACHGTAKAPKMNIFQLKWSREREEAAAEIIRKGKSPMPGFGDKLSESDIADLLAFISSN